MKIRLFTFIFLQIFASSVLAQKAKQIDEFGNLPCGDFLSRMSNVIARFQDSPDSKIYVIYYGGRYRKKYSEWNQAKGDFDKLELEYPHREDGINWAKSIPLYLTKSDYPTAISDFFKEKIVLVGGGFRENNFAEIWIVPKNAEPPRSTPTIDEKDIKFSDDKPFGTHSFGCNNCVYRYRFRHYQHG